MSRRRLKIGLFDSGFGGLTVLRALLPLAPGADFLYLGDSARLPYGSKSRATIVRYALSSTRFLAEQGADFLVIACNTASALALDEIRSSTSLPVLGVIDSGVSEARACSTTGDILVIATDATVGSHAYAAASEKRGMRALEKACPLLVPLVEEGWSDHPVTAEVIRIYLGEIFAQARQMALEPDTLVLGCTHYPLLRAAIETAIEAAGPAGMRVIDSARALAEQVAQLLAADANFLAPGTGDSTGDSPGDSTGESAGDSPARRHFFATDSVEKFERLGAHFLGSPIGAVELVDLG